MENNNKKEIKEKFEQVMQNVMEDDIAIFTDSDLTPLLDVTYHSKYFYIGLCTSGNLKGLFDYKEVQLEAQDICFVLPNHPISVSYKSDDYKVISAFISPQMADQLLATTQFDKFFYYCEEPCIHLNKEQFDNIRDVMTLLYYISKSNITERSEQLLSTLKLTFSLLRNFTDMDKLTMRKINKSESLFTSFYDEIVKHHIESREVQFYADLLGFSPKYFATIIKQATGISASDWINRFVIIESKTLLSERRDMSIQQIAHHMGFSEQSAFCRYFKANAGMTPKDYRDSLKD